MMTLGEFMDLANEKLVTGEFDRADILYISWEGDVEIEVAGIADVTKQASSLVFIEMED